MAKAVVSELHRHEKYERLIATAQRVEPLQQRWLILAMKFPFAAQSKLPMPA